MSIDIMLVFLSNLSLINWSCLFLSLIVLFMYRTRKSLFNELSKIEEIERQTEKRLKRDDFPPFYPNGWLPILESNELKKGQIKPIVSFGNDLVAFRGVSGKVTVMDAYCPHLGANLGYGGEVSGESIKCPFHGWVYNNEGSCMKIPGINDQNLPNIQMKVWDSLEINGFIFVWNHSKGEKPNWFPPEMEKNLHFIGKSETFVNCHIKEMGANVADPMHLNIVHGPLMPFKTFNYLRYDYKSYDWNPSPPPNGHMLNIIGHVDFIIFGYKLINSTIELTQIGPAHKLVKVQSTLPFLGLKFNLRITEGIITVAPLKQRHMFLFYMEEGTSFFKQLIGRLVWLPMVKSQFDGDILIWENQKYLAKPYLTKNDGLIKFNKWFNQFYSTQ